jgi:hypothetical protein
MKEARRDLATGGSSDVLGWIAGQKKVWGLQLVDLNYPEHFEEFSVQQVGVVSPGRYFF